MFLDLPSRLAKTLLSLAASPKAAQIASFDHAARDRPIIACREKARTSNCVSWNRRSGYGSTAAESPCWTRIRLRKLPPPNAISHSEASAVFFSAAVRDRCVVRNGRGPVEHWCAGFGDKLSRQPDRHSFRKLICAGEVAHARSGSRAR